LSLSRSYYAEKATRSLVELSLSRAKLGRRLERALLEFLRVPREGLPEHIAPTVKTIDAVILKHPDILKQLGDDAVVGGRAVRDLGTATLNYAALSWQKQDQLAESLFIACTDILRWSGEGRA
jgi:hypothetical protein